MKWVLKALFWILAFAIVSGIVALAVLYAATRPTLRVVWQNCQPETITYDRDGYCIAVIERDLDFSGWPLYLDRRHAIVVTWGTQTSYGHMIDYSFTYNSNLEDYINQSQAEWAQDGVTFVEQDGHRLFFPSSIFTGGR